MNEHSPEQARRGMEEVGEAVWTYLSDPKVIAIANAVDDQAHYDVHFAASGWTTPQGYVGRIGVTFHHPDQRTFSFHCQINHQPEYRLHYLALLAATAITGGLNMTEVDFHGHSLWTVNVINGAAHVTDPGLTLLRRACKDRLKSIGSTRVFWVPKHNNAHADALTYFD